MSVNRQVQWRETSSYAKSADTRRTILDAALSAFGEAGFNAVTTRQIADLAQVNQPAISYYFKNKQGLYLACAHEIIDQYVARVSDTTLKALNVLEQDASPQTARTALKALVRSLAELMISSNDMSAAASFVEREMREPGLAYSLLYDNFWQPGVELAAHLVAAIKQIKRDDPTARVEAIMLISSLVAFSSDQSVAVQAMGWSAVKTPQLDLVLTALNKQIDAI
ncbi:MAG: CerR family C-terminal domain-containing protein [Alphaproteobacteria bacterium]